MSFSDLAISEQRVRCGYCNTSMHKEQLYEQPDGLECPVCGTFAFCD